MRLVWVAFGIVLVLAAAAGGVWVYAELIANPRVVRELMEHPDGERAGRVMLLTLPSGRRLPVNYLRKDDRVFAGADGGWWKELVDDGQPVSVLLRGEQRSGRGRAILDDPVARKRVFDELRPDALEGFGTLVEIRLDPEARDPRRSE